MRVGFWLFLNLMMLLVTAPAHAASSARLKTPSGKPILVSADSFYRDADVGLMELKGNVQIVYGDEHLSCDRALVRLGKEEVEAEGHILIVSPTARVEGERATMNYVTETGVIYKGYVESQQIAIEGEIVRKTGPKTYEAERASFTACTTCPPAWQFSGARIQAELGGYAKIKNPLFKIAYFPLPIWLPYIVVPLKSDRQTGFLTPQIGFEDGGMSLQEPFFWAISPSQDATFKAKQYQFRGLKTAANYRYALGEAHDTDLQGGEGNVAWMQDHIFVGDAQLTKFLKTENFNRWLIDYKHSIDLPDGFVQKMNINLASDRYYSRDFPEEMGFYGDPALDNRISLTRNGEFSHASVDASYYVNMLERNPVSSNGDAVHRLPELRYSVTETRIGNSDFLFSLDVDYVNFARNGLSYDDVATCVRGIDGSCANITPDESLRLRTQPPKWVDNSRGQDPYGMGLGRYDVGKDVIRSGQRFDIRPEISSPFHLGRYLDVLPAVSFRHTQYGFATTGDNPGFDSSPMRDYAQAQISARTRFSRVFGAGDAPVPAGSPAELAGDASRETRFKHEIEPEISFTTIPWYQQATNPFFGTADSPPPFLTDQPVSDADFQNSRGIQFDYYDRVINRNVFTMGLANKVIRKSWASGDAAYKQVASFKLTQSYDLDQDRKGAHGYPLSDFAALIDLRFDNFETNTVVRYFPYHGYTNTSSRARVMDARGDFAQVSFSQAYLISETIDDPNTYLKRTENIGLAVGGKSRYVDLTGGINYNPRGFAPLNFDVVDWVTMISLKPPGDCWGINFLFQQVIGVGSTYKVGFDYKFGG